MFLVATTGYAAICQEERGEADQTDSASTLDPDGKAISRYIVRWEHSRRDRNKCCSLTGPIDGQTNFHPAPSRYMGSGEGSLDHTDWKSRTSKGPSEKVHPPSGS